ncbi:unnamed protein product [Paramecium pentaurelia]|uniref:Transmembrane protein n=1 Tax=Paramecium pentaurelia TaxID=43138 RepID=A0A8S1XK31_9CILI|nr:unnamed protein product [Paramecium pentaurelia]
MINQRIIQNYQLKLSTLKYDKINNLLYGYDYIQNSIKFFKLQNQLGYFQYNNYKYLLQIQAQSLLFKENYDIISCLQIVEQDNSQFQGYIIGKRLDYGLSCFSENYISLQFSKFHIQSNEPIIVKVAPNSRIEAISDRKELEQICQPKIKGYNLKDSSYFLTYYNKGFHSQQVVWKNDQKYIFQSCRGEQLQQSLVQNQEQTQVFYYIGTIVLVFLELQEVKIFDFQQSLNSYKIIKLPEKISQINQFDDQIVFQPEDSNHIFLLNLSQLQYLLEKFEKQLNETQVLYFKKRASKFVIQYEKHLYIIFQETHSVFSFQDHQIIYSQFEKSSIVFYAIDQLQNKIIQYQYRDQNLIFQECLNLNEYHYQIYIPLTVSCNYGRIIIATKNQSGQFFLFIINLKEMLTYNLDKIIEIGRLEFFSTPQYLYFYDKEKKIQIYQFDYLNFTVNIQDIDQYQNILTINESLIFQSQIQTFPQLNQYIALQFSNYCQKIKKLSASQQILYSKQQSSIQLSFQEYFTGPIYKLKLLNTSNLELHGPFLNRQQLQKCNNPLDQTSCFQIRTIKYQGNTTLYIYLIYLENEYKILKIVNNNYLLFRFIPISQMYLLENDQLIIIIHHQDLCIFQFYEFNQLNSMYLEQSIQNYECMEFPISQCKKEGNLIMLRIQQSIRLFLIHEQQVTELHFEFQDQYDDFFILNNTPNQFLLMKNYQDIQFCLISIYYLDQNQLHFNSSYKLDQQKFQFELLQYELESQILFSDTQIFYKSFKIEQQQIISKIIIFSKKTIFIGLVECQILQKECIYSVSRTLKTPDYSTYEKHQKFDEDFIYLLINQNYYLFDLTIKNSINHIAAFSEKNYEISKFNTTHYLFNSIKQSQDIFIGQIGYEIEILEAGQKQKEIEFNLFAQNEISEEQISLILFNDDLNISIQITKTYLIYLLIMIFIIFMIYFIRRSKLKLQNQVNKTNDQL